MQRWNFLGYARFWSKHEMSENHLICYLWYKNSIFQALLFFVQKRNLTENRLISYLKFKIPFFEF